MLILTLIILSTKFRGVGGRARNQAAASRALRFGSGSTRYSEEPRIFIVANAASPVHIYRHKITDRSQSVRCHIDE